MNSKIGIAACTAFAAVVALGGRAWAHGAPEMGEGIVLTDVALRPGVTSDIHVRIYSKPSVPCRAGTIFAVHGATGTSTAYGPLAEAIFASSPDRKPVCRIAAIDLPGHGMSSLPQGALYGELTLHDYAAAVIESLERLDGHGIRPTTVMGHSQGGMVLQIAQEELQSRGSSLRDAFGVDHAIFLASVGPRPLPWAFHDSGLGPALLSQLLIVDPVLGTTIQAPPPVWVFSIFSNLDGVVPLNAPTPEEVVAQAYTSPESFSAMGELVGMPPFDRPEVAAGIFAPEHGTELDVVAFENDSTILPEESELLYEYLTGEDASEGFTVVMGDDAVHGLLISNPDALLASFEDRVLLP